MVFARLQPQYAGTFRHSRATGICGTWMLRLNVDIFSSDVLPYRRLDDSRWFGLWPARLELCF
ncbi:hypothetical protein C0081_09730 [Cohaesibacter celericrescens]|uniref:Uncharacterized protein n=1 Tax=Cohaesibacter celericrescens TaxID=2067669 RepID=A0A2N5XST8_9HYPH|nr:hypothetical protein C0081_09730 [Cohaesibacter celericrescens]